ncbi:restriction endonuclease subunit S [Streptomyces iakyrus]|uniref:restriction endonuclease subunit S n=1 Tax=Streptomyces iakyrus TaxID=68219 RepID=UPI00382B5EB7
MTATQSIRLRYLYSPSGEANCPGEEVLSVYRDYGVIPKSSRSDNFNKTPENVERYLLVRPGDLVVNRMKAWQGSLGVSDYRGIVSGDYEVLRPTSDAVSGRYMHYALRSGHMIGEYRVRSTGIRPSQWRLYWDQMGDIRILLPCLEEQDRIAAYLDSETAEIDTLIAEQQRLVEMLRERRQAVIETETLRGINPLQIPADSPVPFATVGHGFSVTLGKMLDAGKERRPDDTELPYVRAANIQDTGLDLTDVKSMPYSPDEAARLDLRAQDVLVVEGGAVGTCVVLDSDMPGWSFQKTVNRLRPLSDWNSRFYAYVIRAYRDIGVINTLGNQSTIAHFTAEKLRALRVPVPAAAEQRRIADYLDRETLRIDTLIAESERLIDLSKERRAALITAAVTGQVDVRQES